MIRHDHFESMECGDRCPAFVGHTIATPISVASAWQRFWGCEPDFIRDVCHARCCDSPSRPGGSMVTIHCSERDAVEARGGVVGADGFLVTTNGCTFKDPDTFLCGLHTTPDKPFGCIASPFTLNGSGTLVVRNRYRMLPCYIKKANPDRDTFRPVFVAFRASLDLIFGGVEAARVVGLLEAAGDPATATGAIPPRVVVGRMPVASHAILRANDDAKKKSGKSG